ncbi:MAG: NAD(P)-binding domain-containing protein [Geothrix sp.]|nr:NAD(P)-binding domain-containing protein [Geothrix sp.]
MRIGFLGLGDMGTPMARNLLRLGHTVTVYNRTPGKAEALIADGARESTTVAEAVMDAEVAITMLADSVAVASVVYGPAGLLQHLPPKSIHLCMSTIEVQVSAELASAHAQADQGYVAAPIFGRAGAAASRRIWIMAGGPEPLVNRCLPIFVALGKGLTRVGPKAALAHALKLSGVALSEAMEKALSEIVASCEKAGMAPADYLRFLNTETFKFPLVDAFSGVMIPGSLDPPDPSRDLAANEWLMALEASNGLGTTHPVADPPKTRIQAAGTRGMRGEDPAALSRASRMETGWVGSPALGLKPVPPAPPPSPLDGRHTPDPERAADPKGTLLKRMVKPRPVPPPAEVAAHASPDQKAGTPTGGIAGPPQVDPFHTFTATDGGSQVTLHLDQTSHFEAIKGQVWAWSHGKRYKTPWGNLGEVELAFRHILFLLIQRHILLRPEATLDFQPTFGGGAKARVGENLELSVSRAAAPRLKELLGL